MAKIPSQGNGKAPRCRHRAGSHCAQYHKPVPDSGCFLRVRRTILVWTVGMLVFVAVIARILTTSVYGDRGRDEINLFSIHPISIQPGGVVTQPVPLQRGEAYAIQVPFRWLGSHPTRIEERLTSTDGSILSETTQTLKNT